MVKKIEISKKNIEEFSYSDFMGFLNQWNTPPGGYSTLSKLALFSKLAPSSYLLEIACTTGFSSRELALMTKCRGLAFDYSKNAIQMAEYNKINYAPSIKIKYTIADGYEFKHKRKFTHIMVGGGLAFFSNPTKMLNHCVDLIKNDGYILATPYYQTASMPQNLILQTQKTLGIPSSAFVNFYYKDVHKLYDKFEIMFEERNKLIGGTDEEIKFYCKSTVDRACKIHGITDQDIYDAIYQKFYLIRKIINEGRAYQEYLVLVLRYRKSVYPNRYVSLY